MKKSPQNAAWPWVLIVLLTLIAYLPAFQGGFIWDDNDYVTSNAALRGVDGLRRIWSEPGATPQYYPLVFSSFWVERALWGLEPFGYHLINILLHAANALLVGLVLRRLAIPGAWLAAAVFALHPVQVESVAWITERKNVLSGFFYLSAAWAYLRFCGIGPQTPVPSPKTRLAFYACSLILFACALLSKSVTCTLPIAILLVLWWKCGRLEWKADVLPLLPMFALGAGMSLMTIWMEHTNVGAQGGDWSLSFLERVLVAGRALWFYAFKLFWPKQLAFNYAKWSIDTGAGWQYLFPVASVAVLVLLWVQRGRISRGPLVAVLFFVVTLFPALGFISYYPMLYSYVADHFQYLASIGLIALGAAWVSGFEISKLNFQLPARIGALVIVAVLAALTWRQAQIYRDMGTLWADTLKKNPTSWLAHNNLGTLRFEEGKLDEASYHFDQALRLNPGYDNVHYNMGLVLATAGKPDEAIAQYREAIRLNPASAQAHNNLGKVLTEVGELNSGIAEFEQALAIKSDYAKAHNNLGLALARREEFDSASVHYAEAIRIDPEFPDPYNNLGVLQAQKGQLAEAEVNFKQALKVRPESAELHANLAKTLSQRGDFAGAEVHYREALRIRPDLEAARAGLLQAEQRLHP